MPKFKIIVHSNAVIVHDTEIDVYVLGIHFSTVIEGKDALIEARAFINSAI